jgi:hypothetical protein
MRRGRRESYKQIQSDLKALTCFMTVFNDDYFTNMMAKLQVHNSLHIFTISNYHLFREFSTPCISFDILRDLSLPVTENNSQILWKTCLFNRARDHSSFTVGFIVHKTRRVCTRVYLTYRLRFCV